MRKLTVILLLLPYTLIMLNCGSLYHGQIQQQDLPEEAELSDKSEPETLYPDESLLSGLAENPDDTDTFSSQAPGQILSPENAERYVRIGTSFNGHAINAWSFGSGSQCIVVAGGIHGRYEETTTHITARLIDYCAENEGKLHAVIKIIPNLNPDSFEYERNDPLVRKDPSRARFNGNMVDLNRNWDTPDWESNVEYTQNEVRRLAGGAAPMSEPETACFADFLLDQKDKHEAMYVIILHSYVANIMKKGYVLPSYTFNHENEMEISAASNTLADMFIHNDHFYKSVVFQHYKITGELAHWCGLHDITQIDLELADERGIDSHRNNEPSHWECFIDSFDYFINYITGRHELEKIRNEE